MLHWRHCLTLATAARLRVYYLQHVRRVQRVTRHAANCYLGGSIMNATEHAPSQGADPQHGDIVVITVDNKPCDIHRGHQTVATIKKLAGVPAAFQLDE